MGIGYYLTMGVLLLSTTVFSYFVITILIVITSSIGNEICVSLGLENNYLNIKVRDILVGFSLYALIVGIIFVFGKLSTYLF